MNATFYCGNSVYKTQRRSQQVKPDGKRVTFEDSFQVFVFNITLRTLVTTLNTDDIILTVAWGPPTLYVVTRREIVEYSVPDFKTTKRSSHQELIPQAFEAGYGDAQVGEDGKLDRLFLLKRETLWMWAFRTKERRRFKDVTTYGGSHLFAFDQNNVSVVTRKNVLRVFLNFSNSGPVESQFPFDRPITAIAMASGTSQASLLLACGDLMGRISIIHLNKAGTRLIAKQVISACSPSNCDCFVY